MRKNLVLLNCILLLCCFLGSGYTTKKVAFKQPLEKWACPMQVIVTNGGSILMYGVTIDLSSGGQYNFSNILSNQTRDVAWSDGQTISKVCFYLSHTSNGSAGSIKVYLKPYTGTIYQLIGCIPVSGSGGSYCWSGYNVCGDTIKFEYTATSC